MYSEKFIMRTILILALVANFIFCDEICENADGDLFWIRNPVTYYNVPNPRSSPVGNWEQRLEVDDHKYTVQVSVPYKSGEIKNILYYKEGFKSEDKIELTQTVLLEIIGKYGFKDLDFRTSFGYQERTKKSPYNPTVSCYHYECDATVTNVNCNLTRDTRSCIATTASTSTPSYFIPVDGIKSIFYGQCQMEMSPVTGNIFNSWIGSAFSKGLPDIMVFEDSAILDWGEAAYKFPEGK